MAHRRVCGESVQWRKVTGANRYRMPEHVVPTAEIEEGAEEMGGWVE